MVDFAVAKTDDETYRRFEHGIMSFRVAFPKQRGEKSRQDVCGGIVVDLLGHGCRLFEQSVQGGVDRVKQGMQLFLCHFHVKIGRRVVRVIFGGQGAGKMLVLRFYDEQRVGVNMSRRSVYDVFHVVLDIIKFPIVVRVQEGEFVVAVIAQPLRVIFELIFCFELEHDRRPPYI